ncbi:MAG: hypothetical protein U0667_08880 [Chloroflexota bacterium]
MAAPSSCVGSTGLTSAHTLTSLGTTSLGTVSGGTTPKLGADGDRVVVAYTQGADLKVRRSANQGVSFGSARTLRNLPDASEVGALATSARQGQHGRAGRQRTSVSRPRRARGAATRAPTVGRPSRGSRPATGGRVLTTLRAGSSYRWAEVCTTLEGDESPGQVRFRRE